MPISVPGRTDDGQKVITIAHPEHSIGDLKSTFDYVHPAMTTWRNIVITWSVARMKTTTFKDLYASELIRPVNHFKGNLL